MISLITSAKTLFPNNVTFTDSGDSNVGISFGGTVQLTMEGVTSWLLETGTSQEQIWR